MMQSLPLYLVGFVMLFAFSGIGNGSVYKMIPAIFKAKSGTEIINGADPTVSMAKSQRHAGALIGIAGAIGAFGGVLVNLAFRQSFLATKSADSAYIAFIVLLRDLLRGDLVRLHPAVAAQARGRLTVSDLAGSDSPACSRCICRWPAAGWWWSAGDRWRPGRSRLRSTRRADVAGGRALRVRADRRRRRRPGC